MVSDRRAALCLLHADEQLFCFYSVLVQFFFFQKQQQQEYIYLYYYY